jgi:hypothetical protein
MAEETMRKSSIALLVCAASAACGTGGGRGAPPSSGGPVTSLTQFKVEGDLGDGNALLAPIRFQSLTLFPIVATGETSTDEYLVLDEAMEKGVVTIDEEGGVNALKIANRAKLPVFLMSGEVVIGGKQDRIIGKNTIITAAATEDIPVFCVEHGRWSGRQAGFSSAGVLAHSTLREKASFDEQGDVWAEVAKKNEKRKTSNPTDTYRESAAQQKGAPVAAFEDAFDRAIERLPAAARARHVGYAVAVNGEMVAVDVFENPRLFAKLDRKLRRSYYAEALDIPANSDARAPDAGAVRAFMARAEAAPAERVHESSGAETINNDGDDAAESSVMSKASSAFAGKGKKPKPVYKSVQKRKRAPGSGSGGGGGDDSDAVED